MLKHFLLLFLCLFSSPVWGADSTATTKQEVKPVLIRNEQNILLQLTIDSKTPFQQLEEITVSLLGDESFESVQFYYTGKESKFSTEKAFGERLRGQKELTFKGHTRLLSGKNHYWLSCRVRPEADLTQEVDAVVTKIKTDQGTISPKDTTPKISKRVGIALRRHWDDGVHTYRIPAFATSAKGTLLCVYDMRRRKGRDLQEDIDIGLLRSTDQGQTWEPQRVIMDMGEYGKLSQELNGVSDPGLIVDPATGEIFCFAVWTHDKPNTHQWAKGGTEPGFEIGKSSQFMMTRSTDDGKTWSPLENMTKKWKDPEWLLYAPSPQQGIVLRDGTLVMPTQGRDAKDNRFSNLLISEDHGKSWTVSAPGSFETTECQAVELSDGSIMLNCRSNRPMNFRTVVTTSDRGKTWKAHPTNRNTLIEPVCNGSTFRFDYKENGVQKSVLLFANPHSQSGRVNQSIQVSFDEGKTWPKQNRLLLDQGRGAGYPSLTKIDNEHVGIVYEGSGAQVVFEKIPLQKLLNPSR